jgi:hypothetical protein
VKTIHRSDAPYRVYFFIFVFANGEGALPALIAAQRRRAAAAIAFRPAALSLRFLPGALTGDALAAGDLCRFVDP